MDVVHVVDSLYIQKALRISGVNQDNEMTLSLSFFCECMYDLIDGGICVGSDINFCLKEKRKKEEYYEILIKRDFS